MPTTAILAVLLAAALAALVVLELARRREAGLASWLIDRKNEAERDRDRAERELERRKAAMLERGGRIAELERQAEADAAHRAGLRARIAELEAPPAPLPYEHLVGHELVLNTRRPDDQSVRGVCLEIHRHLDGRPLAFRLAGAKYISGANESPLGGEIVVPAALSFVQDLGAGEGDGDPTEDELEAAREVVTAARSPM